MNPTSDGEIDDEMENEEPDPGTIFIARQLQDPAGGGDYWPAMADKVESFLKKTAWRRRLPKGCEPEDFRTMRLPG